MAPRNLSVSSLHQITAVLHSAWPANLRPHRTAPHRTAPLGFGHRPTTLPTYIAPLEDTVPVHRQQTHGFNSNPPAAIVVAPDVVPRRRPRPLADLDGQIPTDTTKGHDNEPAIRIPPLSPTQSDGTPAAQSFAALWWPLSYRDKGLARSSALASTFCSRCLCPSITAPLAIPHAATTPCASDLHPQRAFTLHASRLPFLRANLIRRIASPSPWLGRSLAMITA